MANSKSKRHKSKQKQRQLGMERLKHKVAQGPLQATQFVIEPKGQVKMSDVLEQFVDPYLELAETAADHRTLFTLAALAWNAALLPPGEREQMIDGIVNASVPADAGPVRADAKEIVNALVARKQALFADNTRRIINFEITETAGGFHLAVASTF